VSGCLGLLPFEKDVLRLKGHNMKRQKDFSLVLLLSEVIFTFFVAGIVVPSLLRSDLATKEALAAGSLRTISIAAIAFSYTTENVEFATLGGLVGAMAAFAINLLATTPKNTTSTIILRATARQH
jgi:uncharacterized YccA/Bax inhibitor family protein